MSTQVLKDRYGSKIGEIREYNGNLSIHDKNGTKLGTYESKTNVTKDKFGSKIGSGNLLTTLL
jgi:hypothetical protein